MWGHSQLSSHISPFTALLKAQFNTCTSLQSGPFQGPKATLLRAPLSGSNQSQVCLFWPIRGQFIVTNHRRHTNPVDWNKRRSCGPEKLMESYLNDLESYLNDLQRWLSDWRIAINVSKSTAIIFARAGRRFIKPRPVTLFGDPIEWVDTTRYLGVTLDRRLTWSPLIDQVRKRTAQRMGSEPRQPTNQS